MAENTINVKVKQRTDTESNWASKNPVLLDGEHGYVKGSGKYKIGDGTKKWSELSYYESLNTTDKTKLDGIASGATKVTDSTVAGWGYKKTDTNTWRPQPDWSATSGDAVIKNKPSLATVATSGSYNDLSNKPTIGNAASKNVRTKTGVGDSGWKDSATDQRYVPDMAFMAYWNGAYSSTASNLAYCNKGAFGTAATKNIGDFATATHSHTKSQITDFPSSLKNPTALTVQGNGTTLTTYDGSVEKTVNITKASVGLGNVDNTADSAKTVSKANQLTTTRTVSGGTDIPLSFTYNGSANSTASIGYYSCRVTQGNTNNYPFHRIGYSGEITDAWNDRSTTLYITQGYQGGGFGIVRITVRTNYNSVSGAEARWLIRSGFNADQIQLGFYNVYGKTYCDIFLKTTSTYNGTVIRAIGSDARGTISRTFTLCDSSEADSTTASDAKTSKEAYASIAAAGTALHKQAYTSTITGSDNGTVSYANSAGSCSSATTASKIGTSTVGSSTKPVYINGGTPTACTYTLEKSVPSNAVFTDTNTKVTSVGNHYAPSGGTTTSASGGALTDITNSSAGVQVVTGITKDAAGHVTGITSKALKSVNTNTTYSIFKAATTSAAGGSGLVPAPAAGKNKAMLCGDNTWETPHRVAIAAKEPSGQLTNDEWLLEYT